MTLDTLTQGEPWMTPEERTLNQNLTRSLIDHLTAHGAPDTPFTTLRVNEVAITWLLARRLESVLDPTETDPAPCPTPAQASAIDKCRERLRKAMKELEACAPQTAPPKARGLADEMQETIRKIQAIDFTKNNTPGPPSTQSTQSNQTTEPCRVIAKYERSCVPYNPSTEKCRATATNEPSCPQPTNAASNGQSSTVNPKAEPPDSHRGETPVPGAPAPSMPTRTVPTSGRRTSLLPPEVLPLPSRGRGP